MFRRLGDRQASPHILLGLTGRTSNLVCAARLGVDALDENDVMEIGMATRTSAPRRVLIVEHDVGTAATFARMLSLEGYAVEIALSAEDGLLRVALREPDAILVDFHMPRMNGLEFLRRLRARGDSRSPPVAVITGDYELDHAAKTELTELGAVVRFKPLWLEDLTNLVARLLQG